MLHNLQMRWLRSLLQMLRMPKLRWKCNGPKPVQPQNSDTLWSVSHQTKNCTPVHRYNLTNYSVEYIVYMYVVLVCIGYEASVFLYYFVDVRSI